MSDRSDKPTPKLDFADESAVPDASLFEEAQLEPVFFRHVLTSPLHLSIARESRTNLWEAWNGITSPQILTSIEQEYHALQTHVGIADISPLAKYRISGRDAMAYLSRLATEDIATLAIHRTMHVVFCEENGLIVADGQLFRLDETDYRLVTERPHLSWLIDNRLGFRVNIEDVGVSLAALRLIGPLVPQLLASAGFAEAKAIKENASCWCRPGGVPVYVSRGFLPGAYDLWVDKEDARPLWSRLMQHGGQFGLTAIGRRVCDMVRIEAGLPLEGRDYLGALYATKAEEAATPFDLAWNNRVDLAHGVFNGRAALRRMAGTPTRWTRMHVAFEAASQLAFKTLYIGDEFAGTLTSSVFSPLREKHLGIARVRTHAVSSAKLRATASVDGNGSSERISVPVRDATDFSRSSVYASESR